MTVVLLHAFPLDERMWEGLELEDSVAPRLYGRGNSIEDWARRLLDELEGDLVVVGASMGGYCALELLRQAPQRVRALGLIGSRAEADSPERRVGRDMTIRHIEQDGVEAMWDELRPRLFSEFADAGVVERAHSLALDHTPEELTAAVEAMRDRRDSSQTARSFFGPALVAAGGSDAFFTPDEARILAKSMPAASVYVFAGSGHLPSLERPEEFAHVLAELLGRV
jgi:pimeloyl-[acyl-carrier protein] methyl ester esterase